MSMLKKENKLVESIKEHKPKLVLRDLDEYPSEKTVKAVDFRTE